MIRPEARMQLEEALAKFLEAGGMDQVKWFVNVDISHKTNLLSSESIVNKLWSAFVRNGPHDSEIFRYLASAPAETRGLIGSLFSSLINTKDPNQYKTLLEIFLEKHKEWPAEIVASLQEAFVKTSVEIAFPHNAQLLEAALASLTDSSYTQLESIATRIIPWITEDKVKHRSEGIKLLTLINDKLDRKKPFALQECIDKAKELLAANNESARSLLDYIFGYLDRLTSEQIKQVKELISEQITVNKPNQIKLLALDLVPRLIADLDKREVLIQILELAKVVQEGDIKERCKNVLKEYKKYLSSAQEKETKALFGETVFES